MVTTGLPVGLHNSDMDDYRKSLVQVLIGIKKFIVLLEYLSNKVIIAAAPRRVKAWYKLLQGVRHETLQTFFIVHVHIAGSYLGCALWCLQKLCRSIHF